MAVTATGLIWDQQDRTASVTIPGPLVCGECGGDWECQMEVSPRIPVTWICDPPLEVSVGLSKSVLFGVLGLPRCLLFGVWSSTGVSSLEFWSSPGVWGFGEQLLMGGLGVR